jgi:hypothetical protein
MSVNISYVLIRLKSQRPARADGLRRLCRGRHSQSPETRWVGATIRNYLRSQERNAVEPAAEVSYCRRGGIGQLPAAEIGPLEELAGLGASVIRRG